MVETGRIIQGRYLLQRLVKQGQCCAVYQSSDQVLQRPVIIKVVPGEYIPAYRAALRATSQFAHPNIIGIYDLIMEAEKLYVVQEYVEGEDFTALLQTQQSAYQVADLGIQLCQALIYAGGGARKACHGDLTPTSIIRDQRGQARINNFALPSDIYYFTGWSVVGGDGRVVSDRELPWGKSSDGRREDDTRAVGLLMYQLLMSRTPGSSTVEPPTDGRLRFTRNVPAEFCEIVARAIIRQHPQHINNPEDLHRELKAIIELFEPPIPVSVNDPVAARVLAGSGQPGSSYSPARDPAGLAAQGAPAYAADTVMAQGVATETPIAGAVPDLSVKLSAARQAAYPQENLEAQSRRRVNLPVLIVLGLVLFVLFFVVGYFVANAIIH